MFIELFHDQRSVDKEAHNYLVSYVILQNFSKNSVTMLRVQLYNSACNRWCFWTVPGTEDLCSEADSCCSGQPIHLWQFLRELLLKPHNYSRCIRWLNKEKGKLSVWGQRVPYCKYVSVCVYVKEIIIYCRNSVTYLSIRTEITWTLPNQVDVLNRYLQNRGFCTCS